MSENSHIQWTDATWNPVVGCTRVSPGCANCYAIRDANRMGNNPNPKIHAAYNGLAERRPNGTLDWTGVVRCLPERLEKPLHWREPKRIFVNSQSDLFHELVPDEFICKVFTVMRRASWHIFQVLTKRPDRMRNFMEKLSWHSPETNAVGLASHGWQAYLSESHGYIPDNIWLGTSVENQRQAELRIPYLLQTPAAVRFLSCEPLLGPVDLDQAARHPDGTRRPNWGLEINWVIVGGESGAHHRPFDPQWARDLRDQCRAAGVAYWFKQHGGLKPTSGGDLLDGVQHHEFPEVVSHVASN